MITFAENKNSVHYTDEQVNAKFLELLPSITYLARRAYAESDADKREEAVQSIVVTAFQNIKQLAEKGRLDDAYATPIAKFAIGRYREGRHGGVPSCGTDVTSERCRWLGRSSVKNYGLATEITDSFESQATATDARYPVHKTVALRIDFFETWYASQSSRDREIIRDLAMGETTNDVSRKYGFSAGRISQLRRQYADSWYAFINPVEEEETDFIDELRDAAAKYKPEPAYL